MEAISPSIGAWAVLVAVKCGSRDGKSSGEQFSLPRRPVLPVMPASSTTTLPRCPLTPLQFTSHTVALIPLSPFHGVEPSEVSVTPRLVQLAYGQRYGEGVTQLFICGGSWILNGLPKLTTGWWPHESRRSRRDLRVMAMRG
jgi:hypothetical protein